MAPGALRRLTTGVAPVLLLSTLLLGSLALMSDATTNSTRFDEVYSLLLVVNVLGLLLLAGLIALNVLRLVRQRRAGVAGARLTTRMLLLFAALAVTPVVVVFYFSVQFLNRGIDSWFDVQIEAALDDALELSRSALDSRMRESLRQVKLLTEELAGLPNEMLALRLDQLRERVEASELVVLSPNGRIISASSADSMAIVPHTPDNAVLLQVRQTGAYVGLDLIPDSGLHIRVAATVPDLAPAGEERIVQSLFPVAARMNELAANVQAAYAHYRELVFLRGPLKRSFTLTLSLVLLLSLLSAAWAAFFSARRLVAPVRDLVEGTRAVADGDYETQLPAGRSDELGFLVESFNAMTRRLARARDAARRSQQEVEEQRTYLEAVLSRMSSGVITLDEAQRLFTVNDAAGGILGISLLGHIGEHLEELARECPHLAPLTEAYLRFESAEERDWRQEITLFGPRGRQVLMCRGTPLAGSGHVIVFDDVTALIQAQRDAAWSEVARRLAHEIKNPLTPIRLSAERVRHKYLGLMDAKNRETLDRLTHTIIQQVDSMKAMVDAFSSYARPPQMNLQRLDLNALVGEVVDLYRYNSGVARVEVDQDPELPSMEADPGRMRQLLHNLVKNALEAGGAEQVTVTVRTRSQGHDGDGAVGLVVEDTGSGFSPEVLERACEPYVTTKSKGTGLGLAIAKKIVEEHGGIIHISNRPTGGAHIEMVLPATAPLTQAAGGAQRAEEIP